MARCRLLARSAGSCDAPIRSLLDGKRTLQARRERVDMTRMTEAVTERAAFAAMHGPDPAILSA